MPNFWEKDIKAEPNFWERDATAVAEPPINVYEGIADPNEAYKKAVEIQDLAVKFEAPIDSIEQKFQSYQDADSRRDHESEISQEVWEGTKKEAKKEGLPELHITPMADYLVKSQMARTAADTKAVKDFLGVAKTKDVIRSASDEDFDFIRQVAVADGGNFSEDTIQLIAREDAVRRKKAELQEESPRTQNLMFAFTNFTNLFNVNEYLDRQGLNPFNKGEYSLTLEAVNRILAERPFDVSTLAIQIGTEVPKIILEFAAIPDVGSKIAYLKRFPRIRAMVLAGTRFAVREAVQAPAVGETLRERAKKVTISGGLGAGIGASGAFIPTTALRAPVNITGFSLLTYAMGGSREDVIRTAATIGAFEAVGLLRKGEAALGKKYRATLEVKALEKAKAKLKTGFSKKNIDLSQVPEKALENLVRAADKAEFWAKQYEKGRITLDVLNQRRGPEIETMRTIFGAIGRTQKGPKAAAKPSSASKQKQLSLSKSLQKKTGISKPVADRAAKMIHEEGKSVGEADKLISQAKYLGDDAALAEIEPPEAIIEAETTPAGKKVTEIPEITQPAEAVKPEKAVKPLPAKEVTAEKPQEPKATPVEGGGVDRLQEMIKKHPGTLSLAVKLDSGEIISDSKVSNHGELLDKYNLDLNKVADGGFVVGGEYISSITDAKRPPQKVIDAELAQPPAKPKKVEPKPLKKAVTVSGKKFHPQTLPVESIGVDPEKFQFKLGAKLEGGVTDALKAVEKFDPIKGGTILVWQDKAGKHWVIDGHHRVALARKTGQKEMDAWIVREEDGWTAADARAVGALRNLADGKGTAIDAAKLFRDSGISLQQLRKEGVPTESTIVQQGLQMKNLSDQVFKMVVNERLAPNMAAVIGKNVKGDASQKQVADLILEGEVDTVRQAELLSLTIDSAPILTKSEMTLFGLETTEKSLYAERAKILANVEKKLKTNKKVFGTLAKQTTLIESKGNVLDKVANMQTKELAEEVLFMLEKFANAKGEVSEALNDATKEYAKNPTRENLTRITNDLVQKWTQATTGLTLQNVKGLFGAPAKRVEDAIEKPELKGKAGFVNVEPIEKAFAAFMNIVEPSKAVEIRHGKDVYAAVIRGIHKPDVARIEYNEQEIESLDGTVREFGEKLAKYSDKILTNLMLSRGKPASANAIAIQQDAKAELVEEAPELVGLQKMITRISDANYKFLQDVVGDEINYVEDYFFGIYKDPKKVQRFLDFWKTTDKFTKQKKLPTVADAMAYGLELRDPNPVNNLRAEFMAISRLDGMIWMRDELMRTGEDVFISKNPEGIADAEKIPEPVFKGLWFEPDLARMIKSLISANKVQQHPYLNALRKTNNFLRSIKFLFSGFHHIAIAKQSIADSGYLGFGFKKTASRFLTLGFKKGDPAFQTPEYKKYIEHGGGHRYSIDSRAQRAFTQAIERLTKSSQAIVRGMTAPLRIPEGYVKWLFESYIPRIKYVKYLDTVNEKSKKLGRELTGGEHADIIKEGQNFYGMMNERLFGRSGTVTSAMRFKFMAPGFAEGNFRTILKAILQWGQEGSFSAGRSRADIINSLLVTAIAATVGTLILTGKPPKKPETAPDIRDLFKIDTGKTDLNGRKIMIDLMSYDKDYWTVFGKPLVGLAGEVPGDIVRRLGGMTATTWDILSDLNQMSMGNAIYDWQGNRVVEVTDPFAKRVIALVIHEIEKAEPISVNIYSQSRERGLDRLTAAITTLLGARPTTSEKDKRESAIIGRIFSLRDRQERLYHFLGSIKEPRKHIDNYNKIAQGIMDNPVVTDDMRKKWGKNIIIDTDRLIANKVHAHELLKVTEIPKPDQLERAGKWLKNFDIPETQFRKHLIVYEMKHRKLILEMDARDGDDLLKDEIAKFYADKGIADRKVKSGKATDAEKRLARKYSALSSNISEIGARIHKTMDSGRRKGYYDRIKRVIERME